MEELRKDIQCEITEAEMLDYILRNLPIRGTSLYHKTIPCNHYRNDNMMIEEYDDDYVQCMLCGHKIERKIIKDTYNKLKELEELIK